MCEWTDSVWSVRVQLQAAREPQCRPSASTNQWLSVAAQAQPTVVLRARLYRGDAFLLSDFYSQDM